MSDFEGADSTKEGVNSRTNGLIHVWDIEIIDFEVCALGNDAVNFNNSCGGDVSVDGFYDSHCRVH